MVKTDWDAWSKKVLVLLDEVWCKNRVDTIAAVPEGSAEQPINHGALAAAEPS